MALILQRLITGITSHLNQLSIFIPWIVILNSEMIPVEISWFCLPSFPLPSPSHDTVPLAYFWTLPPSLTRHLVDLLITKGFLLLQGSIFAPQSHDYFKKRHQVHGKTVKRLCPFFTKMIKENIAKRNWSQKTKCRDKEQVKDRVLTTSDHSLNLVLLWTSQFLVEEFRVEKQKDSILEAIGGF